MSYAAAADTETRAGLLLHWKTRVKSSRVELELGDSNRISSIYQLVYIPGDRWTRNVIEDCHKRNHRFLV